MKYSKQVEKWLDRLVVICPSENPTAIKEEIKEMLQAWFDQASEDSDHEFGSPDVLPPEHEIREQFRKHYRNTHHQSDYDHTEQALDVILDKLPPAERIKAKDEMHQHVVESYVRGFTYQDPPTEKK